MEKLGSVTLTNGQLDYDIVFDTPFSAVPDIVCPLIENISADLSKSLITAHVVAKTAAGFSVRLSSAPDSSNYTMRWFAGDSEAVFQLMVSAGKKLSELPRTTNSPGDDDLLVSVRTSGQLTTEAVRWAVIKALFPNLVSSFPGSPEDAGAVGQIAVDGNLLAFHTGTLWGLLRLQTDGWDTPPPQITRKAGQATLTNTQQYGTVTFAAAFVTGRVPQVRAWIENTTDLSKAFIQAMVTARSESGFSFELSSPVDSANYTLQWEAVYSS